MAEIMCAGDTPRGSEFVLVNGVRVFGDCGVRALASALTTSLGRPFDTAAVYLDMRAWGLLMADLPSPNAGMTNSGQWLQAAKNYGADVVAFRGYSEPWADWAAFVNEHAGHSPMVVEVARNYLLRDEISGLGQNANTDPTSPNVSRYHIFTIYGRHDGGYSQRAGRVLPAGYWCADGDSYAGGNDSAHGFQAADVLQFYSDDTMAAAMPCAALALAGRGSVTSMAVDVAANFRADTTNAGWWIDTRTHERIYQGCLDALVRAGDARPVISGIKPLAGAAATTARIVVGSLDTGTDVWVGDGPPDTWTMGFPGNALLHVESALADALIVKAAPPADPVVAANAAIGAAFTAVLKAAGVTGK